VRDSFEDRYVVGVLKVEEARGGPNRCGISGRKSVAGSWRVEWIGGGRCLFTRVTDMSMKGAVYIRSEHGIMRLSLM
jgi:hypothetical protein